jgi:hypothetical protein
MIDSDNDQDAITARWDINVVDPMARLDPVNGLALGDPPPGAV